VAKLLLEHGADITVVNADGWKPLNAASNNGYVEVVKMLLEKGADMACSLLHCIRAISLSRGDLLCYSV
jgi:ankyrin repeat protein